MRTYSTISGDTYDMISFKNYGSELHISDIIAANPTHKNTVIFPGGLELKIPEIPRGSVISNLPPWITATEV